MAIHTEPGRGLKQCRSCKKYVGVRSTKCGNCGEDSFSVKPKANIVISVFNEGGRGRKQCPKCEKYVGARATKCPGCEFDFNNAKKVWTPDDPKIKKIPGVEIKTAKMTDKTDEKPKQTRNSILWDDRAISTPSGPCPVKLKSTSEDDLIDWANGVVSQGRIRDIYYSPGAVLYWLREFVDIHSQEYREAREIVLQNFGVEDEK